MSYGAPVGYLVIENKPVRQYVRIENDNRAHYKSPWKDDQFLSIFKKEIPYGDGRRWDGAAKEWTVNLVHIDFLCELICDTFGPAFILDRRGKILDGWECPKCGKTTKREVVKNQHAQYCGPMFPLVDRSEQEGTG